MTRARDLADSADKDIAGTITLDAVNASGVITGLTVEATGDTAAGDNAAMGYTAAEGLILTGQGSTGDITIKNDADAVVLQVPTGTTNVNVIGSIDVATNAVIDGTALVTGVLTTTAATVFNGGFASNAASTITTADNSAQLTLISTDADANQGPVFVLDRQSANPADGDSIGTINFNGKNDAGEAHGYAKIEARIVDASNATEDGRLELATSLATTEGVSRILMDGTETVFNDNSVDLDFRVESNGNANMLFVDGGNDVVNIGGTTVIGAALTVGKTSVGSNTALRIDYNDDNTAPSSVLELSKEGTIFGRFGGASTTVSGAPATATVVQSQADLYFDATGNFIFNEVGDDVNFRVESDAESNMFVIDGGTNTIGIGVAATSGVLLDISNRAANIHALRATTKNTAGAEGVAPLLLDNERGTGTRMLVSFRLANSEVGKITSAGSTTVYGTSSDYRLKENVDYDWDATSRLKQLKPARFNFIADADTTVDGFLAHEAATVVPEAVTGTKDEVDDNGDAVMQGIDQSKLVPLLVKTIIELEARITALES